MTLHLNYSGEGVLSIRVEDSGCGMSDEQLGRLFQPFSQADDRVARTHGGTGLGLVISRDLARAMGGDVSVQSKVGIGSQFTFSATMPLASPPQETIRSTALNQHTAMLRVLAVDDHEINRRVLALLLGSLNVELTLAGDGQTALECLGSQPFDLLMLDVHMPVMDGYEVAKRLRASGGLNADIPIASP